MTYKPSPRPTFDGPAHIPYDRATRYLWGDPVAGEVADWIYVSSDKIHQIMFAIPPRGRFLHSEAHRTVFAADEVYYVLTGVLVMCNPETGEVQRVLPGEAAFFRRDTWHNAVNASDETLRVIEYFAPPPSQGTSGAYSRTRPYLARPRYAADDLLGQWPMQQHEISARQTMRVIRDADLLWRLEGEAELLPVGLLCATEHLTVGRIDLLPGQRSAIETHAGDECLYLVEGTINVRLPEQGGWHELKPGDGFYLPLGCPHQYFNTGDRPARLIFGVAPGYLAS